MSDDLEGRTFAIAGETYVWGRTRRPADFGMVPAHPGLEEAWGDGAKEWEITIGPADVEGGTNP